MVPLQRTPHEALQEDLDYLARTVLEGKYKKVRIDKIKIEEDIIEGISHVSCVLCLGEEAFPIEGYGKGIVDALFTSVLKEVQSKYTSFNNIQLLDFAVEADFKKHHRRSTKSDAEVETRILLKSSDSDRFVFRYRHTSMITAAVVVITRVIEYFINSEEAVISLYKCIKDAERRSRGDLVTQFTLQLSELVKNVSYEERFKKLLEDTMGDKVD